MKIIQFVLCALVLSQLCSCNSTTKSSPNHIVNISDVSSLYDGGSSRACIQLKNDSVWYLSYNRNLGDRDNKSEDYKSIFIVQIEPIREQTATRLPKGEKEEANWLNLLYEYWEENPHSEHSVWISSILKEKIVQPVMDFTVKTPVD